MRRNLMGRAAAVLLVAALMATPVLADTIGGAIVHTNDSELNLRARATTEASVLATAPDGAFLLVEEALDGWYKVAYRGIVGYISADYAEFSESLDGTYDFDAATLGTQVNLRAGATTAAGVVKRFAAAGSGLSVTGVAGNWLKVAADSGETGYVRSDLVRYQGGAAAPVTAADVDAATGEQLAATARQYIGCRYRWGGMSPETGFDCSGFANYIYNLYGYGLERVAQNIYQTNGVAVGWEELQPGDLLFFGYGPRSISHVGIYVGDGEMVHASTYTTGVILTELEDSNYPGRFVGAKRIIAAGADS